MDVRIIANIGSIKGIAGDGVIYAAKTPGGTYLAAIKHIVESVETWRFYRKSMIENAVANQDVVLAGNFNLALLTDQEYPDFVSDTDTDMFKTIVTVVNGADLPRLFSYQNPYTLKGEGVTTSEVELLKVVPASNSGIGSKSAGTGAASGGMLGGLIPTDFSLLFSNPIKFVQDNPTFSLGIVALIYWFRRKKKKPLWLF